MRGVLNETTRTVHKREMGNSDWGTECGATYHLNPDQLQEISIERATSDFDASKCGRCFDQAGGY